MRRREQQEKPSYRQRLDAFLEEEGLLAGAQTVAAKRVLAFIIEREMKRQGLSKSAMAARLKTSRAGLDRLFDPHN